MRDPDVRTESDLQPAAEDDTVQGCHHGHLESAPAPGHLLEPVRLAVGALAQVTQVVRVTEVGQVDAGAERSPGPRQHHHAYVVPPGDPIGRASCRERVCTYV